MQAANKAHMARIDVISGQLPKVTTNPIILNQAILPQNTPEQSSVAQKLQQVSPLQLAKLPTSTKVEQVGANTTNYSIVPANANHRWTLEIFDIQEPRAAGGDVNKTQIFYLLEGKMHVNFEGIQKPIEMQPGQMISIPPGFVHRMTPLHGAARFLAVDFPGYDKPISRGAPDEQQVTSSTPLFIDQHTALSLELLAHLENFQPLQKEYYRTHIEPPGYVVNDVIPEDVTEKKWSLAVIEFRDNTPTPNHYHLIGTEIFTVLNGTVEAMIKGVPYKLHAGQSVSIQPDPTHTHYFTAKGGDARVLCINLPAFDISDHKDV